MAVMRPVPHDFPPEEQEKLRLSSPQWDISVPTKNSFVWCIVLSYLKSANFRTKADFQNRLKILTGSDDDLSAVMYAVIKYNPFLNRYSAFSNKILMKVILQCEEIFKNLQITLKTEPHKKLEIVCAYLNCRLLFVKITDKSPKLNIIPNHDLSEIANRPWISLFLRYTKVNNAKGDEIVVPVWSFGLENNLCKSMQKTALLKILQSADFGKRASELCNEITRWDKPSSFVINILKSNYRLALPKLYRTPCIAARLADAGFETDPRKTDPKGCSAICHALFSGEELVYTLYFFVANACHASDNTFRDPDAIVVANIQGLDSVIQSDCEKIQQLDNLEVIDSALSHAQELLRFNKFISKVSSSTLIISQENNYYEKISKKEFEASKPKRVLESVLKLYIEFFSVENSTEHSVFKDYLKHKSYYDRLDFNAALLFFDNIFLLKERVKFENKEVYRMIESDILLAIFSNKYFSDGIKGSMKNVDVRHLQIIPVLERNEMRKSVEQFLKNLHTMETYTLTDRISPEEISRMLSDCPEMQDEFLFGRLSHYINIALEIPVQNMKSVLVIERALQVLGETLKSRPASVTHLLSLCLPANIVKLINDIRNALSHSECYQFVMKLKAESNLSLFKNIQNELKNINSIIKLVSKIHFGRFALFLKNRGLNILQQFENNHERKLDSFDWVQIQKSKEDIDEIVLDQETLFFRRKTNLQLYKTLSGIILVQSEKKINKLIDMENDQNNEKKIIEEYTNILWSLEIFLTFIKFNYFNRHFDQLIENIKRKRDSIHSLQLFQTRNDMKEVINCMKKNLEPWNKLNGLEKEEKNVEKIAEHIKKFYDILISDPRDLSDKEKQGIINAFMEKEESCIPSNDLIIQSVDNHELGIEENNPETKIKKEKKKKKAKIENPIKVLESIFSKNHVSDTTFNLMCEKHGCPDKIKNKLEEIRQPIKNRLSTLHDRIKNLKKILIDDNAGIRNMWENVISPKTHNLTVYKIVQRYINEPDLQASVEMLFFDCIQMLKTRRNFVKKQPSITESTGDQHCGVSQSTEQDGDSSTVVSVLEQLWIKTSCLFSGINLRDVLAHGDPLLGVIGGLLDPTDWPTALVKKMMDLLKDEEAIECLYALWCQVGKKKHLVSEIVEKNAEKYIHVCEKIKQCNHWKEYLEILPS